MKKVQPAEMPCGSYWQRQYVLDLYAPMTDEQSQSVMNAVAKTEDQLR